MSVEKYVSRGGANVTEYLYRIRYILGGIVAALVLLLGLAIWYDISVSNLVTPGYIEQSIIFATPIALVAIGGLFAEKSGVFNIGVEGFMIFGAVNGLAVVSFLSGDGGATQFDLWMGVVGAMLISVVMTSIFAVLLIRYKADQIVAGLAVWFLGLGFGPFIVELLWGGRRSDPYPQIEHVSVPFLADLPEIGPIFEMSPFIPITILVTIVSWIILYRTRYGYWIQAAGENPEALDTAGVNVNRVRYATLIFSGVMAGLAGAVLTIGVTGIFVGSGATTVDGRGWIGIVTYLFGNYNPIGAALAALLFGAADQLQIQFQTVGIDVPGSLIGLFPYVVVIVVLSLYGKTRVPSRVGEPYESED